MKHLSDIFKSFLGSLLVVAVGFINLDFVFPYLSNYNFNIELNVLSLIFAFLALFIIFIYLFIERRPLRIKNGRIGAMEANVKLLQLKPNRNRLKRYIYSTRVSFWPLSENEKSRNEFRELLTQKIKQGFHVRRIWQLHNEEDAIKLFSYLSLYKDYDNFSLKCFIGTSAFIPEILSVYGKVVSVSIPQQEDPRRLTTAFHFYGNNEVQRWESYFHILWEHSLSIKHGNEINKKNVEQIKTYFNIGETL